MKILQICNKAPYPPRDGHTIAMNNLTQGLLNYGSKVKVLALNTNKHYVDPLSLPQEYLQKTMADYIPIDTSFNLFNASIGIFKKTPYIIERFYNDEMAKKIESVLISEKFDVVQLETLYLSSYLNIIKKSHKGLIILRSHNIENDILKNRAKNEINLLKKSYLTNLADKMRIFEKNISKMYDGIVSISDSDTSNFIKMGIDTPIITIPVSIDSKKYIHNIKCDTPSVFFIGSMDWAPNTDGLLWFLENVWKDVSSKHRNLKFYIAGRKIHNIKHKLNFDNIAIAGEVENSQEFMLSKELMVVPLLYGSGLKVKILEAMSLGKPIITTPVGAEGIGCSNMENIVIANSSIEFIEMINLYINEPDRFKKIGDNAREFYLNNFDIKKNINKLIEFYNSLLTSKSKYF